VSFLLHHLDKQTLLPLAISGTIKIEPKPAIVNHPVAVGIVFVWTPNKAAETD
jgi:hypothetical protein